MLLLAASSCSESADDRARHAAMRVRTQASTRESETVQRVTTPPDAHRILYHAPTDLSDTSARLTNAPIAGIEKTSQPKKPSEHSNAPSAKPPR